MSDAGVLLHTVRYGSDAEAMRAALAVSAEVGSLRAELAEVRRDCRLCAQFYEGRCLLQARNVPVVCINGDAFVKVLPIRLYAIDAAMAGGENG